MDRSATPLLTSVADLEEDHAATGSFQVVVDLDEDTRWVPSLLSGERTTFLATGSVGAIVDSSGVDGAAVQVSDDGRAVVFTLAPAPSRRRGGGPRREPRAVPGPGAARPPRRTRARC